jgi:hypothetical protein
MLKDDVESPIDWLRHIRKSQENVFAGSQTLKDDVMVELSQANGYKHTSTNWRIGVDKTEILCLQ